MANDGDAIVATNELSTGTSASATTGIDAATTGTVHFVEEYYGLVRLCAASATTATYQSNDVSAANGCSASGFDSITATTTQRYYV